MRTDPVFNLSFVGIVEKHPCLYAFNSLDYNNRVAQEKAWESVANEVCESVTDCKERWKNIRGCYTRYLKSLNGPQGSAGKKQPYYLAEPLNFLLQYTKSRKTMEFFSSLEPSVTLEENADNRDDEFYANLSQDAYPYDAEHSMDVKLEPEFAAPPSHKRMKLSRDSVVESSTEPGNRTVDYGDLRRELYAEKRSQDSDLAFLTSLLSDMKEMTSNQKRKFKIGILSLAGQVLNDPQSDMAMPSPSSCASSPSYNQK